MKLFFHPGTNMAQAMAETINYVNRSRAFMPPGTVSPFVMRFDTGSVPVGYLVLSSGTKTIGEIQDQALFKVRPMFAALPGVSAPPPFGGSARSIVIRANPDRLRAYRLSPDDVVTALTQGNTDQPVGQSQVGRSLSDRPDERDGPGHSRTGQHSRGDVGRFDGLLPRSRHDRRRDRHHDGIRARQRAAGGLHPRDQAGRRLDDERDRRNQKGDSDDAEGTARRHPRLVRVRSVAVRHAGHSKPGDRRACSERFSRG